MYFHNHIFHELCLTNVNAIHPMILLQLSHDSAVYYKWRVKKIIVLLIIYTIAYMNKIFCKLLNSMIAENTNCLCIGIIWIWSIQYRQELHLLIVCYCTPITIIDYHPSSKNSRIMYIILHILIKSLICRFGLNELNVW